jgi:hypothetical protein
MVFFLLKKIKDSLYKFNKFKNYVVFLLKRKDFNLKRIVRKFNILLKGINIGDNYIPWIPIKAKLWLDDNLRQDMILYEYGSGLSTLYFSPKVKKIISVEHDKEWYNKTYGEIKEKIHNCEYNLIEPEPKKAGISSPVEKMYISHLYQNLNFRTYVQSIDIYPDKYFDLVFIDGRARIGCIMHSIEKIKPGGFLILDNSDAKRYKEAQMILKGYNKLDFYGIAPSNPYLKHSNVNFTKTSIWIIN